MNCEKCGAELSGQTPFCPYCGTEIPKEEPPTPVEEKQYCTKCGVELSGHTPFCPYCGTAVQKEEAPAPVKEEKNLCKNCGAELVDQMPFCPYCGAEVQKEAPQKTAPQKEEVPTPAKDKKQDYKAYIPRTRTTTMYRIAASALSLLMVFLFLFLPIYQFTLPTSSDGSLTSEGVQIYRLLPSEKQSEFVSKSLTSEKIPALNYSALDELKEFFRFIGKGDMSATDAIYFTVFLFPLFEWIFGIILIFVCAKKLFDDVNSLRNIDETTLLSYEQIKRSGGNPEKQKFFQKQSIITLLLYAVFDIVFGKVDRYLISMINESGYSSTTVIAYSTMASGVSAFVIIVGLGLVGYLVLNGIAKKQEKQISVDILKEDQA